MHIVGAATVRFHARRTTSSVQNVVINGNTTFEEDTETSGASKFTLSNGKNWALSSTGNFDNDKSYDDYIAANKTILSMPNSELYTRARLSAMTLTYYGLCLMNGNYSVKLHFAEIVFTDDRTFNSLGKRIFDVYIQDELVLDDFNIEEKAGGSGRAIVQNFNVSVTGNSLEIRLYWDGKGTKTIPDKGSYDFPVPKSNNALSTGAVVGIVMAIAGLLPDGTIIAVKQLSSRSSQGNREFLNEIGIISALRHPNLVKLYGCCIEGDQLILKIIHRDIKATNVLLDRNLNPKISDFGLAKLHDGEKTHVSTRIAGTFGYMAPEYAVHGYLTDKADVYSFGILTLEIISGNSIKNFVPQEDIFHLVDWVHALRGRGALLDFVDPLLGSEYNKDEVISMIDVALLCTNASPILRPTMSSVISMLEGHTEILVPTANPSSSDDLKFKIIRKRYQRASSVSQDGTNSTELADIESSSGSIREFYSLNPDSKNWTDRKDKTLF
ncbi:hypothetical protein ACLOJK_008659 [Asimina triloba]